MTSPEEHYGALGQATGALLGQQATSPPRYFPYQIYSSKVFGCFANQIYLCSSAQRHQGSLSSLADPRHRGREGEDIVGENR